MTGQHNPFAGIQRLALDSVVFIYFIERNPVFVDRARTVFRLIDAGAIAGYSSVITLTEVLTRPLQMQNQAIAAIYRSFLLNSAYLSLVPVTATVAERAAQLRANHQLRTPDALQIAAALEAQCDAFLTNDMRLQRVSEIPVILFDDLAATN